MGAAGLGVQGDQRGAPSPCLGRPERLLDWGVGAQGDEVRTVSWQREHVQGWQGEGRACSETLVAPFCWRIAQGAGAGWESRQGLGRVALQML